MANAVQWTINQLYGGLQQIANGFKAVSADLDADKAQLTSLWSSTKADTNKARAANNQKLLAPLIHQNSVLRLSYLAPIRSKYNQAVQLASDALKKAGYTTPGLSGLGFVIAIAPATAVVLVVAALALLATVVVLTESQRGNTANVARIIGDANATPAQKQALLKALQDELKAAGIDFGPLAWVAVAVAAAMIVPKLLPARRAAA